MSDISRELAHDLKTPLTIIQGYSSLLQEDCKDKTSPKMNDAIMKIRGAVEDMVTLIDKNTIT